MERNATERLFDELKAKRDPDAPQHGTRAGYLNHIFKGEEPCGACRRAWGRDRSRGVS